MKRVLLHGRELLPVLCFAFVFIMAGVVPVRAEEVPVFPTDVETPSEDCTLVAVEGAFLEPKKAIEKINEIRLEACREGVPNPANPSKNLTMADYVPIKWSKDLEYISRIRAAEAYVRFSFSHTRPNGKSCYFKHGDISGSAEVMASRSTHGDSEVTYAEFGIDLWYTEKSAWVAQKNNDVAGHYTAMINPEHTYMGLGCFYPAGENHIYSAAQFLDTAWHDSIPVIDETMLAGAEHCMQMVEVKKEALSKPMVRRFAEGTDEWREKNEGLMVGLKEEYRLVYDVSIDDETKRVIVPGRITWSSGDSKIAKVNQKGVVTYKKKGTATITAVSDTGVKASAKVKVKYGKIQKPSITKLTGGKGTITVTYKKQKNVEEYEIQCCKNKNFTGKEVSRWDFKLKRYKKFTKKMVYTDSFWVEKSNTYKVKYMSKGTCYVRIRAIQYINDKPYYSEWSKPKKVTVK